MSIPILAPIATQFASSLNTYRPAPTARILLADEFTLVREGFAAAFPALKLCARWGLAWLQSKKFSGWSQMLP